VSGNRLDTLPKEMEELKALIDLDVSRNEIGSYPGHFYKMSVSHLSST
jgi:hypothetical protein